MGCYVNPTDRSKEQWLMQNGQPVQRQLVQITADALPVCLVDNGMFTAAAVCYSESELNAFSLPNDPRPKFWFMVPRVSLRTVSPLSHYER